MNHENGVGVEVKFTRPVWMEIRNKRWTMNNEQFIVYRLTFIVLTERASLPSPLDKTYFLNNLA